MGRHSRLWCVVALSLRVRVPLPQRLDPGYSFRASRDVAYETYKAHHRGPTPLEAANFSEPTRLGISAVQRATFQSVASM